MPKIILHQATYADFNHIIELNQTEVQYTGAMDLARLRFLDQIADYHQVALINQQVMAFLLAMRAGAAYR